MGSKVYLAGAIRGLVGEEARIATIVERVGPDAVGLSVSREGMEAMKAQNMKSSDAKPTNTEERVYIRGLSKYGKVLKPPPCFSGARQSAIAAGIPAVPLDMSDEHYSAAYCKYISTWDMMRQGRSDKLFMRYKFKAETPEEFVIEWDRLVNRLDGYRMLEMARERWFAKGIVRLSEKYGRPLVVVEHERIAGVTRQLREMGCEFEIVH